MESAASPSQPVDGIRYTYAVGHTCSEIPSGWDRGGECFGPLVTEFGRIFKRSGDPKQKLWIYHFCVTVSHTQCVRLLLPTFGSRLFAYTLPATTLGPLLSRCDAHVDVNSSSSAAAAAAASSSSSSSSSSSLRRRAMLTVDLIQPHHPSAATAVIIINV